MASAAPLCERYPHYRSGYLKERSRKGRVCSKAAQSLLAAVALALSFSRR